ncbi:ROK family transcriptional regulator [Microbacterium sp. LWH11-1.2]|uniref:ROK family transcriptional regulator n=1 Tax=Microbacterium sp. LWH11-1.2 TaxID=3135258 RepID=UPI003139153A
MTDQHVLALLGDAESPMSRAEVAEATGLSKPAVSAAAARLSERGVLHEVGVREGRRGGVATLFELNPDHGRSLAVVIQNDRITVQARDLRGRIRARTEAAVTPGTDSRSIVSTTNQLIDDATEIFDAPLLAAAVSIADPVDKNSGDPVVLSRSVFPAAAIQPASELAIGDAASVVVDNDVNWATLGEFREGELRGYENFVYVYFGQGLGAGLLLNGHLFRGHRGLAGEIGYLRDGTVTGGDITEQLAALGLGTADVYGIDLERAHDVLSRAPLVAAARESADVLALAIANLSIVVNPRAIAFGGPLSVFPAFTAVLEERLAALSIDPPRFVTSEATPLLGASLEAHRLALDEAGIPPAQRRAEQ